ncbi:hypothetical protein [uncultured Polaribacter sp.]|uniref:leucine-rich repeat domain-containing protein n=1 Tax=uncultured Polaribacter sp. TaxID=174711 RepID=UPI00263587B7|nr:hypothetical protein [uncultured Polaribacter sp.]
MTKRLYFTYLVLAFVLQSCNTYKRSFGETFTNTNLKNYNKIYRLDLSNKKLKKVPINFHKFKEIRMLNLSGNVSLNLNAVLNAIPNPEKIEVLILDSLHLKRIPNSILKLKNLNHISLNNNPNLNFKQAITAIASLPIQFINLQQNNLEEIPVEISKITSLSSINLSNNHIQKPGVFKILESNKKLKSLWFTNNNIYNLPEEIGLLSNLKNLYLEHNQLNSLPNSMKQLKKLNVLHLGHNTFTELPVQLIHVPKLILLHINNCNITKISTEFETEKYAIKGIVLDNNKLSEKDKIKWRKKFKSFFIAHF